MTNIEKRDHMVECKQDLDKANCAVDEIENSIHQCKRSIKYNREAIKDHEFTLKTLKRRVVRAKKKLAGTYIDRANDLLM